MFQNIPPWKIAATIGGTALTLNAVWLNAEHVASAEGWRSPLVAAGVIVTICAAITPPFAERAAKTGQPAKAILLWLFFGLAVAFSLSASIARSSGYADGKVAGAEHANDKAKLAREAYDMAKTIQLAECAQRGKRCRAAEDALSASRSALVAAEPVKGANPPGAQRLAAVLGLPESVIAMYSPLLLPLGLELGGFIFLAAGLAPRRRKVEKSDEKVMQKVIIDFPTPVTGSSSSEPDTHNGYEIAKIAKPAAKIAKTIAKASGGTKNYYQTRLERDFPEIAKRVANGEISVYAASVTAGLRKAPSKKWTKADAYLESVTA